MVLVSAPAIIEVCIFFAGDTVECEESPVECEECPVECEECPVECEECPVEGEECPVECEECPVECEECPVECEESPVECEGCPVECEGCTGRGLDSPARFGANTGNSEVKGMITLRGDSWRERVSGVR